ncbi:hypothetical protein TRFO_07761 [Tritrichomonas foetus]|uniref:Uncharacterized protein n=1 Tax=Tritrichomonas foetus TaxID=1144522 RepID=A0A1J4JTD4_9EUKA|nr:hypothetical protein TRFO_07761 [Tritrichomonas foetus]|eukprot:OHT00782.1 hypothetical protein TRFO_07761 [Tritrichomonas foetus]
MSFAPRSPPSVKAVSVTSSKLSNTQKKKKALPPAPPSVSFSKRFQNVLFSLYNPQDREKLIYDTLPPMSEVKESRPPKEDPPEFNSPLCAYKIRVDLEEDGETRKKLLTDFHNRSAELVNELSLKEYDQIKVSMVPFDVERTAEDRSVTERQHILDERIREVQDARSTASYRSRDIARKKKMEEDQASFAGRRQKNQEAQRMMVEAPNDYSSPSLARGKIKREEAERRARGGK